MTVEPKVSQSADSIVEIINCCKGNPNGIDEQLFSQYLVRGNPK
jgi:hypothetical protein